MLNDGRSKAQKKHRRRNLIYYTNAPLNSTERKVNDEDISIKGNKGGRKEEWKDVVDF